MITEVWGSDVCVAESAAPMGCSQILNAAIPNGFSRERSVFHINARGSAEKTYFSTAGLGLCWTLQRWLSASKALEEINHLI